MQAVVSGKSSAKKISSMIKGSILAIWMDVMKSELEFHFTSTAHIGT